jgi:sulfoxide reductase heme-binding subunit YedZ
LEADDRGRIFVDDKTYQTKVEHIYAVGDVIGFPALAATSMDYAVRRMGLWWKWLQRWTYAAAVLTLLHWASLHNWNGWAAPAVHFAPLIGLTIYRIWWSNFRPRLAVA